MQRWAAACSTDGPQGSVAMMGTAAAMEGSTSRIVVIRCQLHGLTVQVGGGLADDEELPGPFAGEGRVDRDVRGGVTGQLPGDPGRGGGGDVDFV